jgi:hypothetical protein
MEAQCNMYSNTATTQKIETLSNYQLCSKLNILLQFLFVCKLFLCPPSAKLLNNTTKKQNNMHRTKLEGSSAVKANSKEIIA